MQQIYRSHKISETENNYVVGHLLASIQSSHSLSSNSGSITSHFSNLSDNWSPKDKLLFLQCLKAYSRLVPSDSPVFSPATSSIIRDQNKSKDLLGSAYHSLSKKIMKNQKKKILHKKEFSTYMNGPQKGFKRNLLSHFLKI